MHHMTTKNPRLTITLEPALAAQIKRMSELTGNSQSAIISELLDGSAPVFERVIKVLEAAEAAKGAIKGRLAEDLDKAQVRMEQHLGIVMDEFDGATMSLLDEAEKVTRRARRQPHGQAKAGRAVGGGRAGLTPPSNRGVRSTANPLKKAKAAPGRE
jgi:hypothetical protein